MSVANYIQAVQSGSIKRKSVDRQPSDVEKYIKTHNVEQKQQALTVDSLASAQSTPSKREKKSWRDVESTTDVVESVE